MESLLKSFTAKERKQKGIHYTPTVLADFVSETIISAWLVENRDKKTKKLRIIDPSVGDGELLVSLLKGLRNKDIHATSVFAFDTSKDATLHATNRIKPYCLKDSLKIKEKDFLEFALSFEETFFKTDEPPFDLVIANPPYVRTQHLGAKESQRVSNRFDLSGRIDLYHAFIKGIGLVLRTGGLAGIIVSNRFMSTKGGSSIRNAIKSAFDIIQVWDLGDTKLFGAAVLPAVLLLRKKENNQCKRKPKFSTIYSIPNKTTTENTPAFSDAIQALSCNGDVNIDGNLYQVKHGVLETNNVWRLSNKETDDWLNKVDEKTFCKFGDIGKIAVGVKSTADKVFIRTDWDTLLPNDYPELLKPIITHHSARRFKAAKTKNKRNILYPHIVENGIRRAVDLQKYPKDKAYLEVHRQRLEGRKYVVSAGRNWYELWVPQDPSAWQKPKVVFRDISAKPEFWIDLDGSVVNGDCYWLCANNDEDIDLLWLILAIGNSTFIEHFYDKSFNNKLYAGRRRFMTQYVQKFPLPDPKTPIAKKMIGLSKKIFSYLPDKATDDLEYKLDKLVWVAFGLTEEEVFG